MSYKICFKNLHDELQELNVSIGETMFIFGANGVGKSSLIQDIHSKHRDSIRIMAHRLNIFISDTPEITTSSRASIEKSMAQNDVKIEARYKDDLYQQRAHLLLYDFIEAENDRARTIISHVKKKKSIINEKSLDEIFTSHKSPLDQLNRLLFEAKLQIEISLAKSKVLAKKANNTFSISSLSDGERNILYISTQVITAKPGSLILIDEPERHLHRSIITSFLSSLFNLRNDCAFIISSHDHSIIGNRKGIKVLLIRSSIWQNNSVVKWDADVLESVDDLDDDIKHLTLGERRKILYVEGNDKKSLDLPIYSLLFPEFMIVPVKDCRKVISIVQSIKESNKYHWVDPYGIIDRDDRTEEEIIELENYNIFTLPFCSVESLYYNPSIIQIIAQSTYLNINQDEINQLFLKVKQKFIDNKDRFCSRLIEKRIREKIFKKFPKQRVINNDDEYPIYINIKAIRNKEYMIFENLVQNDNFQGLMNRYPFRESQIIGLIHTHLKLGKDTYPEILINLMKKESEVLNCVKELLGAKINAKII